MAGMPLKLGGVVSCTTTLNEAVENVESPGSVAVHVTVVLPMTKNQKRKRARAA